MTKVSLEQTDNPDATVQLPAAGEYVVFRLREQLYGVSVSSVHEIIPLPELSLVDEAPSYLAGVLNLRGSVLPIINLVHYFGHKTTHYFLDDRIVFVHDHQQRMVGLVVNDVIDVHYFSTSDIEAVPEYQNSLSRDEHVIPAFAKFNDDIVMLLDASRLFESHSILAESQMIADQEGLSNSLSSSQIEADESVQDESVQFFPEASIEVRQILQQRSQNLLQMEMVQELSDQTSLVVVKLNDELFGLELEYVLEFIEAKELAPIPCTPDYMLGNTNLRGDILTVTDVRPLFQLEQPALSKVTSVVVVKFSDLVLGLRVDEVHEVLYLSAKDLGKLPVAVQSDGDAFLKGTINFNDCVVSVVDLHKLLSGGEMSINEHL